MFHHDGPFDACAPSRNRHRTKAPMLAWAGPADEDKEALANAREIPSSYQSPYPSPGVYTPYEAPKKKHDAIAEAWGIHEPEPFEDFSAGGGFAGGGHSEFTVPTLRNGTASAKRSKDGRDAREKYREYLEEPQAAPVRRQQTKRTPIPPPQPIFVSDGDPDANMLPPSPTSPGAPKRTKSLMHRIRKMRENPMVPLVDDQPAIAEHDYSPPSSTENSAASQQQRPTHRSQNSFLGGIFGGQRAKDLPSPSEEAYVYVDEHQSAPGRREKSLPRPPVSPRDASNGADGYFDQGYSSSGGNGLGRKTSLLRKVKTAVKGPGPANK